MFFRLKYGQSKKKQFESVLEKVGRKEDKMFYDWVKTNKAILRTILFLSTIAVWLVASSFVLTIIYHGQLEVKLITAFICPEVLRLTASAFIFLSALILLVRALYMLKFKDYIDDLNQRLCERQEDVLEEKLNEGIDVDQKRVEVAFVYLDSFGNIKHLEYELE